MIPTLIFDPTFGSGIAYFLPEIRKAAKATFKVIDMIRKENKRNKKRK